ncbi:MAG TPA: PEP-CTERM sorting domain-containing protein [bacterium]|nr:PEP-CTERM sorting domain-containing protein [bacterium]
MVASISSKKSDKPIRHKTTCLNPEAIVTGAKVLPGDGTEANNLKPNMKKISAVILVCSTGLIAQAQLIDDFSSAGLSEYTQTIVLQNGASSPLVFSDSTGGLTVSKASGTAAEQVLFLRNDYSLGVGQTLRVGASVATNSIYSDFGIVVSALVNPTAAVWVSGTVDTRNNYIAVYVKGQTDAIGRAGFNGAVNAGGSSGTAGVPDYSNLLGLFINRTAADTFAVGYTTASGDTTTFTYTGMNTAIGNAIGFYADVRGVTSYGTLDNLTITPVPEPSTLALCGMSFLGLVAVMRRKK